MVKHPRGVLPQLMLIEFFDVKGIVHCKFLPQDQMINQHVYKEMLQRLIRSVRKKRQQVGALP